MSFSSGAELTKVTKAVAQTVIELIIRLAYVICCGCDKQLINIANTMIFTFLVYNIIKTCLTPIAEYI